MLSEPVRDGVYIRTSLFGGILVPTIFFPPSPEILEVWRTDCRLSELVLADP